MTVLEDISHKVALQLHKFFWDLTACPKLARPPIALGPDSNQKDRVILTKSFWCPSFNCSSAPEFWVISGDLHIAVSGAVTRLSLYL